MRLLYVDIDTLRADHLGCYGYHRNTSPNIDALAGGGVRFDNVYASDVPCLPSRTALVSGMLGIRNGVINHGGVAADLPPEGPNRGFRSTIIGQSWPSRLMQAGYRTASLSSFPLRHSAPWWTSGFMEAMNLMRGMGNERADEVIPHALDWLDRNGAADDWFLHVHLWDPHTPYNTPASFPNVFEGDRIPAWLTGEVRAAHWELPGPHSAQEVTGYDYDEFDQEAVHPRQPMQASSMDEVKRIFDGYDLGIRYADDAVGQLLNSLADLGVLDDTAVMISSDHGEAFGELGVYCDHQAADEATCRLPMVLSWPGMAARNYEGLHYQLDVTATIADLVGIEVPQHWDGVSIKSALEAGEEAGRDHLVVSQGAWSCQRSVRWDDWIYTETRHDGFHAWNHEMLFDLGNDVHQQHDLVDDDQPTRDTGRRLLNDWRTTSLETATTPVDPMDVVLDEGGPFHCRGRLPGYLERLRATGRGGWADVLADRHPAEMAQ